jgi:hypothetical protein
MPAELLIGNLWVEIAIMPTRNVLEIDEEDLWRRNLVELE